VTDPAAAIETIGDNARVVLILADCVT